jgi:hypothetical protein
MADFRDPIQRVNKEELKEWQLPPAERIEKDRHAKEEGKPLGKEPKDQALAISVLVFFCKKFLTIFSSKENIQSALIDLKQLIHDLSSFKDLLAQLRREDVSRNSLFTRQFSDLWQRLNLDEQSISAFEKDRPEIGPKLRAILARVNSYPPFVDHQLGYYLTEHVGEEWLPFPFMDILSQLHKEHRQKLERSELSTWTAMLQELISSLEVRPTLI